MKTLEELKVIYKDAGIECHGGGRHDAGIKAVAEACSPRWIKVTPETMPAPMAKVLVDIGESSAWFTGSFWFQYGHSGAKEIHPKYWQPLPSKPEVEG